MRSALYDKWHCDYIILMSSGHISNICSVVSSSRFINLVSITEITTLNIMHSSLCPVTKHLSTKALLWENWQL